MLAEMIVAFEALKKLPGEEMSLAEALLIHEAAKRAEFHGKYSSLSDTSGKKISELIAIVKRSHEIVSKYKGYDVAGEVCVACSGGMRCLFANTCEWPVVK